MKNNIVDYTEISYRMLKEQKDCLISLGTVLGCALEDFKKSLGFLKVTKKYSIYSSSEWGHYSPNILNEYIVTNVKKPKRLYNNPPKSKNYYQYLYSNGELVAIKSFLAGKEYKTDYIYKLGNTVFSFSFSDVYKYQVTINQAIYDEKGNILTNSYIETYGMPENEDDEIVLRRCKRGIRAALLDFQKYHYDETGLLDYVDDYKRIYDFSPQIVGLKLGKRFRFIYDESGKRIAVEYDKDAVPCVFEI